MRLSRSNRVILLGTALLAVGLAGRAAAQEAPRNHPRAAASSPAHAAAAAGRPAPGSGRAADPHRTKPSAPPGARTQPARTGPAVRTGPAAARTGPAAARTGPATARVRTGPAGSRLTTGTAAVALTFDDGPDPAQTPRMLKLLAQQHVHATFCLVGQNVRRHPELVRQIVAGGHTLCNHTWKHSLTIGKQTPAAIHADLQRTNDAIHRAAPGAAIRYFRAPGGNFTPRLVAAAHRMGMTSIYWKVDPRDWDHPRGESHAAHRARVVRSVERHVGKGAIVLSHDYAQPDTIAAYRTLIPWLRHRYRLIALPV
jgi:peptidoglycan-N-acetylglucosamine deacetylase